ncbi:hypothetical protein TGARI_227300 [Toxoplasma gondii ARI]|uniref:Uncharacterized protein n=1 Tax=Toxoplasma gondii ARI TaxID=1074872 RepID=A0A139XX31_TOXGO|nr:hypothetical protein TGARI_227300 [Toxoplasma gondii ARI]
MRRKAWSLLSLPAGGAQPRRAQRRSGAGPFFVWGDVRNQRRRQRSGIEGSSLSRSFSANVSGRQSRTEVQEGVPKMDESSRSSRSSLPRSRTAAPPADALTPPANCPATLRFPDVPQTASRSRGFVRRDESVFPAFCHIHILYRTSLEFCRGASASSAGFADFVFPCTPLPRHRLTACRGCRSLSSSSHAEFRQIRRRELRSSSPILPGGPAGRRARDSFAPAKPPPASCFEEIAADDNAGRRSSPADRANHRDSSENQREGRGRLPVSPETARGNREASRCWERGTFAARHPAVTSQPHEDLHGSPYPQAPLEDASGRSSAADGSASTFRPPRGSYSASSTSVHTSSSSPSSPSSSPPVSSPASASASPSCVASPSSPSPGFPSLSSSIAESTSRRVSSCFAQPQEFCGVVKLARKAATEAASVGRLSGAARQQRELEVSLLWRQLEQQVLGEGLLPLQFLAPSELSLLLSWCARGGFFSLPLFLKVAEIAAPQLPLWPARDVQTLLLAVDRFVAAHGLQEGDKRLHGGGAAGPEEEGQGGEGGERGEEGGWEKRRRRQTLQTNANRSRDEEAVAASTVEAGVSAELPQSSPHVVSAPANRPSASVSHASYSIASSPCSSASPLCSSSLCGEEGEAPAAVRAGRLLFTAGFQHLLAHLPAYRPRHLRNLFDVFIAHEALLAPEALDADREASGVPASDGRTRRLASPPGERGRQEMETLEQSEADEKGRMNSRTLIRLARAASTSVDPNQRREKPPGSCSFTAGVSDQTPCSSSSPGVSLPFQLAREVAARAHLLSPAALCETAFFFFTLSSRGKTYSMSLPAAATFPTRFPPLSPSLSSVLSEDLSHSSPCPDPSSSWSSASSVAASFASLSSSSSLAELAMAVGTLVARRLLEASAAQPPRGEDGKEQKTGEMSVGLGAATISPLPPSSLLRVPTEDASQPRRKGRSDPEAFAFNAPPKVHSSSEGAWETGGRGRSRPSGDGEANATPDASALRPVDGETYAKAAHVFCRLAYAAEKRASEAETRARRQGREDGETVEATRRFWRHFLHIWLLPHLRAALAEQQSLARLLLQIHERKRVPRTPARVPFSGGACAPSSSLATSAALQPLPFSATYLGMVANALTFCPFSPCLPSPSHPSVTSFSASASSSSSDLSFHSLPSEASFSASSVSCSPHPSSAFTASSTSSAPHCFSSARDLVSVSSSSELLGLVWRELLSPAVLRVASQEILLRSLALMAAAAARCRALRESERTRVFEELLDPALRCLDREANEERRRQIHAEKKRKNTKNATAAGLPEKLLADAFAAVFASSPSSSSFFLTNAGLPHLFYLLCARVDNSLEVVPLDILVYILRAFSNVYVTLGSPQLCSSPVSPSLSPSSLSPASSVSSCFPASSRLSPSETGVSSAHLPGLQAALLGLFQRACNTRLRAAFLSVDATVSLRTSSLRGSSLQPAAREASLASASGLSPDCLHALLAACTRFGKVPVELVCAINRELTGFAAPVPRPPAAGRPQGLRFVRTQGDSVQHVAAARRAIVRSLAPPTVPLSHVLTALSALSRLPFRRRFSPQWEALEQALIFHLEQSSPSCVHSSPFPSCPPSPLSSSPALATAASADLAVSAASGGPSLLSLGDLTRAVQTFAFALREPPVALLAAVPPVLGPQVAQVFAKPAAENLEETREGTIGARTEEGREGGLSGNVSDAQSSQSPMREKDGYSTTQAGNADAPIKEEEEARGDTEGKQGKRSRAGGEQGRAEGCDSLGESRGGANDETRMLESLGDAGAEAAETSLEMVCMNTRKTLESLVRLDSQTRGVPRKLSVEFEGDSGEKCLADQGRPNLTYSLEEDPFWKLTEHTLTAFMKLLSLPFISPPRPSVVRTPDVQRSETLPGSTSTAGGDAATAAAPGSATFGTLSLSSSRDLPFSPSSSAALPLHCSLTSPFSLSTRSAAKADSSVGPASSVCSRSSSQEADRPVSAQWNLDRLRTVWHPHGVNTIGDAASCATLLLYPPVFFSAFKWWRNLRALERLTSTSSTDGLHLEALCSPDSSSSHPDSSAVKQQTESNETPSLRSSRTEAEQTAKATLKEAGLDSEKAPGVEAEAKRATETQREMPVLATGQVVIEVGEDGEEELHARKNRREDGMVTACQTPTNVNATRLSSAGVPAVVSASSSASSLSAAADSPSTSSSVGPVAGPRSWTSISSVPSAFPLREVDHVRTARFLCCIVVGIFDGLLPSNGASESPDGSTNSLSCSAFPQSASASPSSSPSSASSVSSSSASSSRRVAQLLALMEKNEVLVLECLRVAAKAVDESETRRRAACEGDARRRDTPEVQHGACGLRRGSEGALVGAPTARVINASFCQTGRRSAENERREEEISLIKDEKREEEERKQVASLQFHDEKEEARNPPLKTQTSIVETVEKIALLGWKCNTDFVVHEEVHSMLFTIDILLTPRKPSDAPL